MLWCCQARFLMRSGILHSQTQLSLSRLKASFPFFVFNAEGQSCTSRCVLHTALSTSEQQMFIPAVCGSPSLQQLRVLQRPESPVVHKLLWTCGVDKEILRTCSATPIEYSAYLNKPLPRYVGCQLKWSCIRRLPAASFQLRSIRPRLPRMMFRFWH